MVVIPLTIRMPNREIITSTHTALISKTDLPIEARKAHICTGHNKALLSIGTFVITDANQYSITRQYSLSIKGMGK